ncbi:MAG: MmgE/PrpD family protein [Deltaproteobacteria bacterium]|nr:MmgE/PrpD family protein [Deltaproteobacteria bacterium]
MSTYSEEIAAYIARLSFADLPPEVVEKGKHLFLDTLGVMILGAETAWSRSVFNYFSDQGGVPEAEVVYYGVRLPAASAAFVNGTMAHSFDYDDDLAACHVACCVIPAALAAAQKVRASGKDLLTAIAIGYDVTVRLAETLDGHHLYAMGFHPTPVCGTYGATAAVSKILGLSSEQIADALGIAGSYLSGSLEWVSDGSMTKRFHGGKSASEGILACSLAKRGFTGPRSIFEGSNGIFRMYQRQRDPRMLVEGLGERFDILKSYLKWYPCCTCNAPLVDALLEIRQESRLAPEDILDIEVRMRKTCMALVGEPLEKKQNPQTILDAQMSAPYCAAVALLEGRLFPAQFTPEKIQDPKVQALMKTVRVLWAPDLDVQGSPRPVPAEVNIKLSDGRSFSKRVDYQKGTYRHPLTFSEVVEKFRNCVGDKWPRERTGLLISQIEGLEKIPDANRIRVSQTA